MILNAQFRTMKRPSPGLRPPSPRRLRDGESDKFVLADNEIYSPSPRGRGERVAEGRVRGRIQAPELSR
jgi:hypothetical protein